MFFLFLVPILSFVSGRCTWKSPTTMFPEKLVRAKFNNGTFKPRARLLKSVIQIATRDDESKHVIHGGALAENEEDKWPNAVPGDHHHRYRKFSNGLDKNGRSYYSIIFDKTLMSDDIIYKYNAAEPASIYRPVDLDQSVDDHIVLARITHDPADTRSNALAHVDSVKIWIGVRPRCLPDLEIGRVPYDIDVKATYDLNHGYENLLQKNTTAVYSSRGWIPKASVIMHPPISYHTSGSVQHVMSPCGEAWVNTSLEVVNTSQFTFWDVVTQQYKVSTRFIGNATTATPRCHRRAHGNVCSVIAKARVSYRYCHDPVAFSVSQAVSQLARFSPPHFSKSEKPSDFNASRRLPVVYENDTRYDMCEAHACEDENACTSLHIENRKLMRDGAISIEQHDVVGSGFIETVCHFEVIGGLDGIWSPHIYFRQWAGFNYTVL